MVALTAHLAQVRDLPVLQPLDVGLRPIQQPGDLGSSEQRVVLGLERGELLAAHVGAAARHHDRSIPAQEREGSAEGMQAAKLLFELLVG